MKLIWMLFILCYIHSPLFAAPSLTLRLNMCFYWGIGRREHNCEKVRTSLIVVCICHPSGGKLPQWW